MKLKPVYIDPDTHRALKEAAARAGVTLREYAEEILTRESNDGGTMDKKKPSGSTRRKGNKGET